MRPGHGKKRIVVIGNGPAGNWAASKARALDPGCHLILLGEEPEAEYSPCALPHYVSGQMEREKLFLKSPADYDREGIEFHPGVHVEQVDARSRRVYAEGPAFDYDGLILATGSEALIPPIEGSRMEGCFTLRTIGDSDALVSWRPREIAVVGCGPIGLECAALLLEAGCRVHLYEILPRVAQGVLDGAFSDILAGRLRRAGIDLHLGEKVREVLIRQGRVAGIAGESGEVSCDTVIWATGVRPRTQLADCAGLKMGASGGILVDEEMRASQPEIFACGDCAESVDSLTGRRAPLMLWGPAVQQGIAAGANVLGHHLTPLAAVKVVSMNILALKICSAGLTLENARDLPGLNSCTVTWRGANYSLVRSEGRLIGIQALGEGIDPVPFQAFLSGRWFCGDPCRESNLSNSPMQNPRVLDYPGLSAFQEILDHSLCR